MASPNTLKLRAIQPRSRMLDLRFGYGYVYHGPSPRPNSTYRGARRNQARGRK